MAKVKEYPFILFHFLKDLSKGDFKTCSQKLEKFSIYFLDKCLKRDCIVRYAIWKHRNHQRYSRIDDPDMRFAIVYFYEKGFDESRYRNFLESLKNQNHDAYKVFLWDKMNPTTEILKGNCSHICFVEQNDRIADHALNRVAAVIHNHPSIDLIYSDEDVINRFGIRSKPYFKPQYSPLLLFSHNYMNALLTIRLNERAISLLKKIQRIDQSSVYKLVLELTRDSIKVFRISEVLYHRHFINAHKLAITSTKNIILDEIKSRDMNAVISDYKIKGINQIKFYPKDKPKISIIIPFRDKVFLLKQCIESIETLSTYDNYEIILINNRSEKKETYDYLKMVGYKIIDADMDFNFSKLNNIGAEISNGEYLILLNNDTKIITPDWIETTLGLAQLSDIGSVGIKLLYDNKKTQHAGISLGVGLLNRSLRAMEGGYHHYNNLIREVLCVSGACMMVSKAKYKKVGGLTEELAVECNDLDFGLKLFNAGHYNIFNPHGMIYHYDSITLKKKFKQKRKSENEYMMARWSDYFADDPFFNPNLTRDRCDFAVKIT